MHTPKRVVIIGCGGVGSWLAPGLARALEFQAPMSQLLLIDGDNFELKNAERQNFTQFGNKAHSLRNDIQPIAPQTMIIAQAAWVVAPEAANEEVDPEEEGVIKLSPYDILQDGDFVFPVVDNYMARKLIFDAASSFDNIDVLSGGNDERLAGSVYHYQRRDGQDVTFHPAKYHEEYENPPDRNPGELSCAERAMIDGGSQTLAANMAVATLLLAKASHAMFGSDTEKEKMLEYAEIYFDFEVGAALPAERRVNAPAAVAV